MLKKFGKTLDLCCDMYTAGIGVTVMYLGYKLLRFAFDTMKDDWNK